MSRKNKLTPEELADAYIFPIELTPEEQKQAAVELAAIRKQSQLEMTKDTRVGLLLFQLKFHIENYFNNKDYDPEKNFGYFLKRYIDILTVKRKVFAAAISIDETMLSQYINRHRTPPLYVAIRLELLSKGIIPADYWYKLIEKEREHQIKTDQTLRKREKKFVHMLQTA